MRHYYIGIDIGGTKIAGALTTRNGLVVDRFKMTTPKQTRPQEVYDAVLDGIDRLLQENGLKTKNIQGIGVGVPGIVDTRRHRILAMPNILMTGYPLGPRLKRKYRVPVLLVNDVNAGLLGEVWKGVARGLKHVVGIFPGTGVGGAAISHGNLVLGVQGAGTELGHMIMDVHGPLCHCGNRGCLEALSSRWAIERDVRALAGIGRKTSIIKKAAEGPIKSKLLKEALEEKDEVVTEVMTKAAGYLGQAAVSVNHIFNPHAIVFGGGVIKACGSFILPIVRKHMAADPFFKKFNICRILQSKLEDDAVTLGAVHLVQNS